MGSFRLSGHFQWFPFQFLWYPSLRTSRLFDVPSRVVSDLFFSGHCVASDPSGEPSGARSRVEIVSSRLLG